MRFASSEKTIKSSSLLTILRSHIDLFFAVVITTIITTVIITTAIIIVTFYRLSDSD
jgi:hypothetical protein